MSKMNDSQKKEWEAWLGPPVKREGYLPSGCFVAGQSYPLFLVDN